MISSNLQMAPVWALGHTHKHMQDTHTHTHTQGAGNLPASWSVIKKGTAICLRVLSFGLLSSSPLLLLLLRQSCPSGWISRPPSFLLLLPASSPSLHPSVHSSTVFPFFQTSWASSCSLRPFQVPGRPWSSGEEDKNPPKCPISCWLLY